MRLRLLLVLLAAVLVPSPRVASAAFPVAEPTAFPISLGVLNRSPSVATDRQGNSVVVWDRPVSEGTFEVVAQRFDPQGQPLSPIRRVNTTGFALFASVAMNARGAFVVTWVDFAVANTFGYPLRFQLFAPDGAKVGPETPLNSSPETQGAPARVGIDRKGGFAATWRSPTGDFVRRFDRSGVPLGPEILAFPQGDFPGLAMRPDGSFTLVGRVATDLFGLRFDADGEPKGEAFQINQDERGDIQTSTVAGGSGSGFVVAWDRCSSESGNLVCEVNARRFDNDGHPDADQFAVSPRDGRSHWMPVVAKEDGRGDFAVSWANCLNFAVDCRVSTQLYSPHGRPAPNLETLSDVSVTPVTSPSITASPAGFLVVFAAPFCTDPDCGGAPPAGIYGWRFDF